MRHSPSLVFHSFLRRFEKTKKILPETEEKEEISSYGWRAGVERE
jgi:hypothetical protein